MNFTKKLLATTAISIGLSVVSVGSAQAIFINRSDFDASATKFNFENSNVGDTIATDGNLKVTDGEVVNFSFTQLVSGKSYSDSNSPLGMRFDFSNPVSAVGFNFVFSSSNTRFQRQGSISLGLFDSGNSLIEKLSLNLSGLAFILDKSVGYLGLNAGSNLIASASISVIDNPVVHNY